MKKCIKDKIITFLLALVPMAIILFFQLFISFVYLVAVMVYLIANNAMPDNAQMMDVMLKDSMLLSLASNICTLAVILPVCFFKRKKYFPPLSEKIGAGHKFYAFCFAECAFTLISVIITFIINLFNITDSAYELVESSITLVPFPMQLAAVVIIGPICEEIVFRKLAMNRLMKSFSPTTAIIISALLFGILHGNFTQGINAVFIGIIIGYVYLKTGSLTVCIVSHVLNNLFSILEMYYGWNPYVVVPAISAVLFIVPAVLFVKKDLKIKVISRDKLTEEI